MKRIAMLALISMHVHVASGIERDYPLSPPLMTVVETHQNLEINEERIVWAQTNNQHSNFGGKLKLAASKPNKWRNDLLANESKHYTLTYIANGSESVLFNEETNDSAYIRLLNKASVPYTEDFIIIESAEEYRGASDVHDIYYLHLYFLTKESATEGITIKTDERRYKYEEDYNPSDYDISLVYDNKDNPYLYLNSAIDKKLLKVESNTKSVEDVSHLLSPSTPSFNCNGKLKYVEYLICTNPGLAGLDRVASQLYNIKRNQHEVKESQVRWLKARNRCGDLPEGAVLTCLSENYEQRIHQLNAL